MRAVQERERVWMVWQDVYGFRVARNAGNAGKHSRLGYFKATSGYLYSKLLLPNRSSTSVNR